MKAAYSFALGKKANNEIILGLSLATPFGARAKPQYGTVAGRVTDEKTGAALVADISFPKDDEMPLFSTDATGTFEVKKVKTGVMVVKAGAPGYQPQSVPLEVKKNAVTTYDFKLRSLVAYGVIAGQVLDAATKKPLRARIEFPSSSVAAMYSDDAGGAFRVNEVPTGVYSVTAALEGYFTGSQTVTVEDGKVATAEFSLSRSSMTSMLSGSVTDAVTGKPIAATISFTGPSLPEISTDRATGFYKVEKIPVGSVVVKASAGGYSPAQASVAIEMGKAATQNFKLSSSATPRETPAATTGVITGVVRDASSKQPLRAFVYFPNSNLPVVMSDGTTGFYTATVPFGAVMVACSLPGYVRQVAGSPTIVKAGEPAVYNFEMIKIGTEITLSNAAIHFAFNSSEIQSAGYPALDEWVKMMNDNPGMTAEIQGHTDAVGSESYNQALSERRAASVVGYLTGRGIARGRLTSIGYGESRLVVQTQGKSEENRRVILKVTGEK